jgi:hypothetical protein
LTIGCVPHLWVSTQMSDDNDLIHVFLPSTYASLASD